MIKLFITFVAVAIFMANWQFKQQQNNQWQVCLQSSWEQATKPNIRTTLTSGVGSAAMATTINQGIWQ